MPWKNTDALEQRNEMIVDWLKWELSIVEIADIYGVSRKTIYKCIARFKERGRSGLQELSREPLIHANATPSELVAMIIAMK